jgi:hypothetical protein
MKEKKLLKMQSLPKVLRSPPEPPDCPDFFAGKKPREPAGNERPRGFEMLRTATGMAARTPVYSESVRHSVRSLISSIAPSLKRSDTLDKPVRRSGEHGLVAAADAASPRTRVPAMYFHTSSPNFLPRKVVGWRKAILERRQGKTEEEQQGEDRALRDKRRKTEEEELMREDDKEDSVGLWPADSEDGRQRMVSTLDLEDLMPEKVLSGKKTKQRQKGAGRVGKKMKGPEETELNEDLVLQQLQDMGLPSGNFDMQALLDTLGVGVSPEEMKDREWSKFSLGSTASCSIQQQR